MSCEKCCILVCVLSGVLVVNVLFNNIILW